MGLAMALPPAQIGHLDGEAASVTLTSGDAYRTVWLAVRLYSNEGLGRVTGRWRVPAVRTRPRRLF